MGGFEANTQGGDKQSVVCITEFGASVDSAVSNSASPTGRDQNVVECLPSASVVAVPGPVVNSASWEPRVYNTECRRLAQFEESGAVIIRYWVHVNVSRRAGPRGP